MSVVNSEIYEIQVCVDCAVWHANGELPHDATDERIFEIIHPVGLFDEYGVPQYAHVSIGDGEFFSRYGCDLCGSTDWGTMIGGSYRLIG